jgi:citrate synthase
MFTVLFALGRLPGWIAQWLETVDDPSVRIFPPRQIYTGYTQRELYLQIKIKIFKNIFPIIL